MAFQNRMDKNRIIVIVISILVGLALILAVLGLSGYQLGPAGKLQTFEARLSVPALVAQVKSGHSLPLTSWRIYDRLGRQVGEIGMSPETLNAVLQSRVPVGSTRTLAWELSQLVDVNDGPLGRLPDADFTIVKYWAESCKLCQVEDQRGAKVLQDAVPSYKNLAINVLHVDADIQKRLAELGRSHKQNGLQISADARR